LVVVVGVVVVVVVPSRGAKWDVRAIIAEGGKVLDGRAINSNVESINQSISINQFFVAGTQETYMLLTAAVRASFYP